MSKKKNKGEDYLTDILMRGCVQAVALQYEKERPLGNDLLQKEDASRWQERQFVRQRDSELAYMAMQVKELKEELHKVKKSMRGMEVSIRALNDNSDKREKKWKGLSEQVDKLWQKSFKQKDALKKYRAQMRLHKKILRLMGTYIGMNHPSDSLDRILNKCSKKLDLRAVKMIQKKRMPEIIDGDYREV